MFFNMQYIFLLTPFLFAFIIALILSPITIKLAKKMNLVDDPIKHKHPAIIHKTITPRGGGLPIFLAIVAASLLFLPFNPISIPIFTSGLLVVVVGLLDDKYDLSPYIRFTMNIVSASIVVFLGLNLPFITNPLGGILHFQNISVGAFSLPVSNILAVIWIVWVMNMLNWSKGVDGQMPGIAAISALIIGIAALRFPIVGPMNIFTSTLAFITAGAALGFLIFNFHPAKIFPGYSGTILGFTIAILSLLSSVKLATALLVMGVPATDFIITFMRRVLSKRSPFWGDKGHLHHLLLNLGFSQRRIALFYWSMSGFLGILSLNLSSKGKIFAIILVLVIVGGFILFLKYVLRSNKELGDVKH